MDEIAIANQLSEMALQLRASARTVNLDEESRTRMLLAAAELDILAEKIEGTARKPAGRRPLAG